MDYKKAAQDLFRKLFFEPWMDETDWQEFQAELKAQTGFSEEILPEVLEHLVKKGYTIEQQTAYFKALFEQMSKQKAVSKFTSGGFTSDKPETILPPKNNLNG